MKNNLSTKRERKIPTILEGDLGSCFHKVTCCIPFLLQPRMHTVMHTVLHTEHIAHCALCVDDLELCSAQHPLIIWEAFLCACFWSNSKLRFSTKINLQMSSLLVLAVSLCLPNHWWTLVDGFGNCDQKSKWHEPLFAEMPNWCNFCAFSNKGDCGHDPISFPGINQRRKKTVKIWNLTRGAF